MLEPVIQGTSSPATSNKRIVYALMLLLVLSYSGSAFADEPAIDAVYLQEVSEIVPTEQPVESVVVSGTACFALIGGQLSKLEDGQIAPVQGGPANVRRLLRVGEDAWLISADGLYRHAGDQWQLIDDKTYVDLCMHNGAVHAATHEEIFRLEDNQMITTRPEDGYYSTDITMLMEDGTQLHADPVRLGPVHRIVSYAGTLHVLRPGTLVQFDGKTVNSDFIDWGRLPSREARDMAGYGNAVYIATDRGLGMLRGAALKTLKGEDGLPVEDVTCLEAGFAGDLWLGTNRGAVRMINDQWHYFGADHWLPDNKVYDVAVGDSVVYIATEEGIGIIRYEPYTLLKKADYYERHLEEWGHKRMGFIHTIYERDGEWVRDISDNDGGHTATYLTAMCYKYAVTGDPQARQEAVESFKAMLWLDRITPIDGFIARSIWSVDGDKGQRSTRGSGGLPAKWYQTKDGKWYWKGDTSSDEVTAHFYAVALFHDLVATGRDKKLAAEHLTRMASYIMDNGWQLIDMDGETTRWGRWNPEYLLRPYGYSDRGLNGLEALMYMKTAHAVSGDQKYVEGYRQLVDWGYLKNTLRQKNTFPPEKIAPWDDNLAFESYATILRYTDDPMEKSFLLRSLARTWEVKRMEHIPWFNYVYGAYTGNDCEIEKTVDHLRAWTLDCIEHNFRNSHRDDLFVEAGYTSYEGGVKAISPRESCVKRGSRRAIDLDGGAGSRRIMEPTGFIRDYWMARYYGFIQAPETSNPELTSVKRRPDQQFGAAPYAGTPRPKL